MNRQAQGNSPLGLLLFPNRGLLTCLFRFAKISLKMPAKARTNRTKRGVTMPRREKVRCIFGGILGAVSALIAFTVAHAAGATQLNVIGGILLLISASYWIKLGIHSHPKSDAPASPKMTQQVQNVQSDQYQKPSVPAPVPMKIRQWRSECGWNMPGQTHSLNRELYFFPCTEFGTNSLLCMTYPTDKICAKIRYDGRMWYLMPWSENVRIEVNTDEAKSGSEGLPVNTQISVPTRLQRVMLSPGDCFKITVGQTVGYFRIDKDDAAPK